MWVGPRGIRGVESCLGMVDAAAAAAAVVACGALGTGDDAMAGRSRRADTVATFTVAVAVAVAVGVLPAGPVLVTAARIPPSLRETGLDTLGLAPSSLPLPP